MTISGKVGRTWRYYSGKPLYAFGDGLSYSSFATQCKSHPSNVASSAAFTITVDCTSLLVAGAVTGDEILLVVHSVGADVIAAVGTTHPIPFGTLRDFSRSNLTFGGSSAASHFEVRNPLI